MHRIDPYPAADELAAYYDDDYVTKGCPGAVSHAVRYSPAYAPRVHGEYELGLADLGLDAAELTTLSVLDLGCAEGVFLDFLRDRGHPSDRLLGADISEQMVAATIVRGHRAIAAAELDEVADAFDLITLWDVLEHVPDPGQTVLMVSRLLAPGGRVLVQTPRIGLISEELADSFEHYLPVEHVHLFPRETLLRVFEDAGFAALAVASFGANAPLEVVPQPYKSAFDRLAKATDHGATQLVLLRHLS